MSYTSPEHRDLIVHLDNAQQEGYLSPEARKLLVGQHVHERIALAQGTHSSEVAGDHVTFITILADNSGSLNKKKDRHTERMEWTDSDDPESNTEAVRLGQKSILEALSNTPNPESILLCTQVLNDNLGRGVIVDPYRPLARAVRLNRNNFSANGDTPLISRTIEVLGGVTVKAQEAFDEWKSHIQTATIIISDGGESPPGRTPEEVRPLVESMRRSGMHFIAAMGISDGVTNFRQFFTRMGIDSNSILEINNDYQSILQACGIFASAATAAANPETFPLLLKSGFDALKELPGQQK